MCEVAVNVILFELVSGRFRLLVLFTSPAFSVGIPESSILEALDPSSNKSIKVFRIKLFN